MGFLGWYRRFYLLINVPVLLLVTELVMSHYDVANHPPFNKLDDLASAYRRFEQEPPDGKPFVMLVGNSAIREGVDQHLLEKQLSTPAHPLRVYNFGVKVLRVDDVVGLVDSMLARGIKPKAVVIGVNPFLIDDVIEPDSLYPWLPRRAPYLVFHNHRIRTGLWRIFTRALGHTRVEEDEDEIEFAQNVWENKTQSPAERKKAINFFVWEFGTRQVADYPEIAKLADLAPALASRGVPAYLVLLPMNPAATSELSIYPGMLAAMRAHLPPGSLDAADGYPDEMFHDVGHPNLAGRTRLTKEIAAWLATKPDLP